MLPGLYLGANTETQTGSALRRPGSRTKKKVEAMQIAKDAVVEMEFTLMDSEGEMIDETDGEPLMFLVGYGEMLPGLENALLGKKVGESVKIVVAAAEGYGEVVESEEAYIDRSDLPEDYLPEIGDPITIEDDEGKEFGAWIIDMDEEKVVVDANHPLAGEDLHFDVQVISVRAGSSEEIEHGHAHGEDHVH